MQDDIQDPYKTKLTGANKSKPSNYRLRGHSYDRYMAAKRSTPLKEASAPKDPKRLEAINEDAPIELSEEGTPTQPPADKVDKYKFKGPHTRHSTRLSRLIVRFNSWSRRRRIAIGSGLFLLLLLAGFGVFGLVSHKNPIGIIKNGSLNNEPVPTVIYSPLTGMPVTADQAKRPVTAIMIENSIFARPQSGLQDAGVVFEAIAEGGITRFIALFQEARPQYVGPVRSLRPYYIDFATPFEASIVHVGGSPTALAQIRSRGRDLDQFFNANYFWRVNSRDAPHNVYTSFDKLDVLNKVKGYKTSKFVAWSRKDDKKLTTPTARSIDIAMSGPDFNVHYGYDPKTNTYYRREGGAPHMYTRIEHDPKPRQLHPKVVIAAVMPFRIIDASGHGGYNTAGKGIVYIFQDGGVIKGTWIKKDREHQFQFVDDKGKTIALDRGQTWVTIVADSHLVTYAAK